MGEWRKQEKQLLADSAWRGCAGSLISFSSWEVRGSSEKAQAWRVDNAFSLPGFCVRGV